VRKILRSGATALEYQRLVQPRPKLGAWHADLDRMLLGKGQNAPSSARHKLPKQGLYLGLALSLERVLYPIFQLDPALVETVEHLRVASGSLSLAKRTVPPRYHGERLPGVPDGRGFWRRFSAI